MKVLLVHLSIRLVVRDQILQAGEDGGHRDLHLLDVVHDMTERVFELQKNEYLGALEN